MRGKARHEGIMRRRTVIAHLALALAALLRVGVVSAGGASKVRQLAIDPGPRGGNPGAGQWFANLSRNQVSRFGELLGDFEEQNEVTTGEGGVPSRIGLGPR